MLPIRVLLGLVLVCLISGCQTRTPDVRFVQPSNPNFEKDIAAFEARDKANPPADDAILFLGSSSIRLWKTLESDFPARRVLNRGFGGSHIADSIYYADRVVFPYRPRKIVFYAGTNDLKDGKTPEQVFADFQLFVATVHKRLPDTEIAFIAIAPNPARWNMVDKMQQTNRMIRNYARFQRGVTYIDVYSKMLDDKGQPKEGIYVDDKLHMNAEGYKIWREVIGPTL